MNERNKKRKKSRLWITKTKNRNNKPMKQSLLTLLTKEIPLLNRISRTNLFANHFIVTPTQKKKNQS